MFDETLQTKMVKSIIYIILAIIIIYIAYNLYKSYNRLETNTPWLISDTKSGSSGTKQIPGSLLPRSDDGQYGVEFTYAFWLYINNNNVNYNPTQYKHIFHKGSSTGYPLMAPGVWLAPTSTTSTTNQMNQMVINMNTFTHLKETITVNNLPVDKWFHVVIVVMNKYVDVYINGNLKTRYQLSGIPKQNYDDLWVTNWGGFSGYISKLRYFAYAVPYWLIDQMLSDTPSMARIEDNGTMPPYFSENYWLSSS